MACRAHHSQRSMMLNWPEAVVLCTAITGFSAIVITVPESRRCLCWLVTGCVVVLGINSVAVAWTWPLCIFGTVVSVTMGVVACKLQ